MTAITITILGLVSISQGVSIMRLAWVLRRHRRELDRIRAWAIGTEVGGQWRK